ncbi:MAG: WbqC family protein [Bacteroidales bacterium]|nr:WbqC family protein [Bacteroidales bacterium]
MDKLFNLPYFGSVWHWAQFLTPGRNVFEAQGNYLRRTFRSRTTIMSANGPIDLTVPVYSGNDEPYLNTRVNYSTDWASEHLNAFRSAYNASPFYEFYEDDFKAVYAKNHQSLWQLNLDLMNLVSQLLSVNVDPLFTDEYVKVPEGMTDFRRGIEHKNGVLLAQGLSDVNYYQVFQEKYGFVNGLSILDLLFNMGPEGKLVLQAMIQ